MSMQIMPAAASIVTPKKDQERRPFVLDESIPKFENPNDLLMENMREKMIEKAKNKPDDKRNFMDYLILAQDKVDTMVKDHPVVCYMA